MTKLVQPKKSISNNYTERSHENTAVESCIMSEFCEIFVDFWKIGPLHEIYIKNV